MADKVTKNNGFIEQEKARQLLIKYYTLTNKPYLVKSTGKYDDMINKIDLIVTDATQTEVKHKFDVKSSTSSSSISYTYKNQLGEYSKAYNGDLSVELLFKLKDSNTLYRVDMKSFKESLFKKIRSGKSNKSLTKLFSSKSELIVDPEMNYDEILKFIKNDASITHFFYTDGDEDELDDNGIKGVDKYNLSITRVYPSGHVELSVVRKLNGKTEKLPVICYYNKYDDEYVYSFANGGEYVKFFAKELDGLCVGNGETIEV